jgi:hypothetical protein
VLINPAMLQGSPPTDKPCIITLGIDERPPCDHPQVFRQFGNAIQNMRSGLENHRFSGGMVYWDEAYPPGCPTHTACPFGFKPFCFYEAHRLGYNIVLWLDSSVHIVSPVAPLFEVIERQGYVFFQEDHSVGEYCKDEALAPLGITREESFQLPSCWACAVGLDLRNEHSRAFLQRWKDFAMDGITFPGPKWSGIYDWPRTASQHPQVKGHRYDQTVASVVALQLGMDRWLSKEVFGRYFDNKRKTIPRMPLNKEVMTTEAPVRMAVKSAQPKHLQLEGALPAENAPLC